MRHARLVILGLALFAPELAAQAIGPVQIHGFGSWGTGSTDGNDYLHTHGEKTEYAQGSFALNLGMALGSHFRASGQGEAHRSADEAGRELDYLFGEWRFGEALAVRAGRVKQPFGLYTEVFHVGTLRPFQELPQAVYGSAGFIAEGFDGAGISGAVSMPNAWNVSYDLYSGKLVQGHEESVMHVLAEQNGGAEADEGGVEIAGNLVGARLMVRPNGMLTVGVSSYTGESEEGKRVVTAGGSGELLQGRWSLRSEMLFNSEGDTHRQRAFYAEGGARIGQHWQTVAQYNQLTTETEEIPADTPESLLEHREGALGLNYWVNPNLVFKSSYHLVRGNRLAAPHEDELVAAMADGTLRRDTRAITLGAAFSF